MGCCGWKLAVIVATLAALPALWMWYQRESDFNKGIMPLLTPAENRLYSYGKIPDLSGKVHIVTGANSGLGFAAARALVMKGATTVLAGRSQARCEEAAARLRKEFPDAAKNIEVYQCDLASFASVKAFAKAFSTSHQRLDGLQLNAGIMHSPFGLSEDGIEMQFAVNHVGHHLLTKLLLPVLKQTAAAGSPVSVVSVSSNAAFMVDPEAPVRLTLASLNDNATYSPFFAYGQSKLANILFAQELSDRLQGTNVFVNSLNPGAVATDLPRHWREGASNAGALALRLFDATSDWTSKRLLWSAEEAALTQLYLATSLEVSTSGITGEYFVPIAQMGNRPPDARNITLQKQLWAFTEELIAAATTGEPL